MNLDIERARVGLFLISNNFYYTGRVKRETNDYIILIDLKGKEWIIPKSNISSLEVQEEEFTDSYT